MTCKILTPQQAGEQLPAMVAAIGTLMVFTEGIKR